MNNAEMPKNLKRIVAISNFGDFVGGGERSFFDVIYGIGYKFLPVVVAPMNGALIKRFKTNNINAEVIPFSRIRPWFFTGILKSIRSLKKTVDKANASLIYANGSKPAFYGGIVGRILKIPVIWHCRIAEKDFWLDFLLSWLSGVIVVNSRGTAKRFSKRIRNKIRIIYNGIDTQWLNEESVGKANLQALDCRIILVVARVSKCKRHDLALNAFEEAARVHPDLHLVLVGAKDPLEPEWWNYLQKRTLDSPYSERIHWIGQLEDVRPWYRVASILLLPSENESFGRVLVEAMACGIPVVATRGGGVPEIVRHEKDGILVSMGNSRELATAIRKLLENNTARLKMGESGKERAKEFGIECHIRAIINVFEETIGLKKNSTPGAYFKSHAPSIK